MVLTTCLGVEVSWENTGEQSHRLDSSYLKISSQPHLLHKFQPSFITSPSSTFCVSRVLETKVTGQLCMCAHTIVQIHACFP